METVNVQMGDLGKGMSGDPGGGSMLVSEEKQHEKGMAWG